MSIPCRGLAIALRSLSTTISRASACSATKRAVREVATGRAARLGFAAADTAALGLAAVSRPGENVLGFHDPRDAGALEVTLGFRGRDSSLVVRYRVGERGPALFFSEPLDLASWRAR